jgi:hypothetical protein
MVWHLFRVNAPLEIPLRGPKAEPVDFSRTIVSHGVAELAPNRVDFEVAGGLVPQLAETVAHMFRLDEDLSDFYDLVRDDELSWCALGAGRMLRAPTVFMDVVNTT